ncbi:hypothetical protein OROGR_000263 [Orobanche gracilis]
MTILPPASSLLFLISTGLLCSISNSHTFYIGGEDGWSLHPSENYNHWAKRYRFEINDELFFKYKKGHDSILVVNQHDYTKCNKDNPIKTLKSGHSKFKLDRSGPFFFISGHEQNCEKGQKLTIIVLSHHHHHHHHHPETPLKPVSPAPTPSHKAPTSTPVVHHSPNPSSAETAPAHAPSVKPPTYSPSPDAKTPTHSSSPSPAARTHAHMRQVEPQSPSRSRSPLSTPIEQHSHSPIPHHPSLPQSEPATRPDLQHQHHSSQAHLLVLPPHHAPAPAPSASSKFSVSFVHLLGFGLAAMMISAGIV